MKHLPILGLILLVSAAITACRGMRLGPLSSEVVKGSGKVIEESRNVNNFHAVNLATLGDMTIQVGNKEELRIQAEDNILPLLTTQVENNRLVIGNEPNANIQPTQPIKYFLTVKQIDDISASSLGNITAPDLEAEALTIHLTSAGNITLGALKAHRADLRLTSMGDLQIAGLTATTLNATINGAGDIRIDGGEVKDQEIELTSMGNYLAGKVNSFKSEPEPMTGKVSIKTSGSGNAELGEINTDTLDVKAHSMGAIRLVKLTAVKINVEIKGAGDITIGTGEVRDQFITLGSMGSYQAKNLKSARVDATISGSGSAYVQVSDQIKANLYSMGNLVYTGEPRIEQSASGAGKVMQAQP